MKYMFLLALLLVFSLPSWVADLSEGNTLSGAKSSSPGTTPSELSIYQYEKYTVQKGDTLWRIAIERLENPFSWPKVWQINPEIANADLIYPGQVIKIPLDLLKPKYRKFVKASAPVPAPVVVPPPEKPVSEPLSAQKPVEVTTSVYLAKPEFIAAAGFISDDLPGLGTIVGSPSEKQILGKNDTVYVNTNGSTKGKSFSLYRKIQNVYHPVTGAYVGILYDVLGSLEITGRQEDVSVAKITHSYNYIEPGSILGEYYKLEAILVSQEPRTPNISGYVIATKELKGFVGEYELVYLDQGADDGLIVGDIISISKPEKQFHGEKIGKVQVIKTMPSTATAMIIKSKEEVRRGYAFGPASLE